MIGNQGWRVRLTAAAERDIRNILQWTAERFGHAQARIYSETLSRAIQALTAGPNVLGCKRRDEVAEGLFTLHVARGGRKGRHLVLYRVGDSDEHSTIDVLRLLHDSMDLVRHVNTIHDASTLRRAGNITKLGDLAGKIRVADDFEDWPPDLEHVLGIAHSE